MVEKQPTEILAEYVARFDLNQAPADVVSAAKLCILDTLGAAIGACNSPEIAALRMEMQSWEKNATGLSTVWGTPFKTGILNAVLINGCMSHALELDDNHSHSKSHPGGVIVSACWPVAEALGCSGKEFLSSIIVGYDVMGRIGSAVDIVSVRKRGFHNTGIFGPFGAAAGASRLMGLSQKQIVSAFGIAGTQSAGLWGFLSDGAGCKKLNMGKAAVNGTLSAMLAKGGMTGPVRVLDYPDGGLYPAVSDSYDIKKVTAGLNRDFVVTQVDKKFYPSCRTSHPAIDAALYLRNECGILAEQIASVLVESYEVAVFQCGFSRFPYNSMDAKFSIPFLSAAAFVDGSVTLNTFGEKTMSNPLVKTLVEKTSVVENEEFTKQYYQQHWGCKMTVTLKDQTVKSVVIRDAEGSYCVPPGEEKVREKFRRLSSDALTKESSERLIDSIMRLDELDALPDLTA